MSGVRALIDAGAAAAPLAAPAAGAVASSPVGRGAQRFWTTREVRALREAFPRGGLPACLAPLPGRSAAAIYAMAGKLGLSAPKGVAGPARHAWTSSPQIDAVIRRVYTGDPAARDVARLAATLGRPRWWVSKRAVRLGLVVPRFRAPPWSEAEDAIVREAAHLAPSGLRQRLARAGFDRTETAIVVHLKRLGADRSDPGATSAGGLADLMGVDRGTVTAWIAKGWLVAKRRGTARTAAQGGDEWRIGYRDVRRFVIDHPTAVDLRKVEPVWFIDLLAGGGA